MKTLKTRMVTFENGGLMVRVQGSKFASRMSELSLIWIRGRYQFAGKSQNGAYVLIGLNDAYHVSREAAEYVSRWVMAHPGVVYANGQRAIRGHRMMPREHGQGAFYQVCSWLTWYLTGEQVEYQMNTRLLPAPDTTLQLRVKRPPRQVRHVTGGYPAL